MSLFSCLVLFYTCLLSYCIQAARLYSTTQSVSSSSNLGLYQLVGGAALGASIVVLATTASASDALHPIAMPFNHKGYMEGFDTARYGEFIYSRVFSLGCSSSHCNAFQSQGKHGGL